MNESFMRYVLIEKEENIDDHGDFDYRKQITVSYSPLVPENCVYQDGFFVGYRYADHIIPAKDDKDTVVSGSHERVSAYHAKEENTFVKVAALCEDGCYYEENVLVYCSPYLKGVCSPVRPFTAIAENAFQNCNGLRQIVLPEGLGHIKARAFRNCNSLETINIPSTVDLVGPDAFAGCVNLKHIDLSRNHNIGVGAFVGTPFYDSVHETSEEAVYVGDELIRYNGTGVAVIREGTKVIRAGAFKRSAVTAVVFPKSLQRIEKEAFHGCDSLTEVELPEHITYIGAAAFSCCRCLTKVTIRANVTTLYQNIFYACRALKEVKLPTALKKLEGGWHFRDCSSLETLEFPDGFECIEGEDVFDFCSALRTIRLPGSVSAIPTRYDMYRKKVSIFPKSPEFVLQCERGSFAAEYAAKHGVNCAYTDEKGLY